MTGSVVRTPYALFSALTFIVIAASGCATKNHVRQVVGPVEARVNQTEKRNAEQQAAIGELGNSVSRADERAQDADRKATAAGESAQRANDAAQRAGENAQQAKARADQGYSLAESTRTRLGEVTENIDNYKLVTTENVLFMYGKSVLTKPAKEQLDTAFNQIQGTKNYILEIEGFTDSTGGAAANLELSRKRADAVVRYLTTQHNVPLRKINVLGLGEDNPAANNKTKEGRKQARKVELKVFALDLGGQAQSMNMPRTTGEAAAQGTATSPASATPRTTTP